MDEVLKAIREADEETLLQYLGEILERRRLMLNGGEVLYREFTKEAVERRAEIMKRMENYEKKMLLKKENNLQKDICFSPEESAL